MSWLMRTNIKARVGSQGTLFGMDKSQLSNAARWPRGYTPERLNQVRPHLVPHPLVLRDESTWHPFGTGSERRNLLDTVARSTVPESHLLGLQWEPGQPPSAMHNTNLVGEYSSFRGGGVRESPLIRLQAGHATTGTPIHEIGHHASDLRGPVPYKTPEQQGHEEGLADNYEQEHFRDRSGLPVRVPAYGGGLSSANVPSGAAGWVQDRVRARNTAFYDSYHAVRGTAPMGTAIDAEIHTNPTLPGLERYNAGYVPNLLAGPR